MNKIARSVTRGLLRKWAKIGKAPGLRYQWIQKIGPSLAESDSLMGHLPNGCVVECDIRDEVLRHIYFSGIYEDVESFIFFRLLQPGMTVLDVGANIGQYTMLASTAVGPTGHVHSFEPVEINYQRLSRNVQRNKLQNVQLNRVATWHEATTLRFQLPADSMNNNGSFHVSSAMPENTLSYEAKAIRLDDYVREQAINRVDVIKMDVEGAEAHTLRGAAATLERDSPIILMEVNREALEMLGSGTKSLMALLNSWGYRAWRIELDPARCHDLDDLEVFGQGNVLLHRGDLPSTITEGWNLKMANRWGHTGF